MAATQFTTWAFDSIDPLDPSDVAWASDGLWWDDELSAPVPVESELSIEIVLSNL